MTKGNAFLTKIATDCDNRLSATVFIPGDLISSLRNTYFEKPPIDKGGNYLNPTGFLIKKTSNPYVINSGPCIWNPRKYRFNYLKIWRSFVKLCRSKI